MAHNPLETWWIVIPYFILVAFSIFLAYPVCTVGAGLLKKKFPYAGLLSEAPVMSSAAGVDTLVTAFPMYLAGLPWWYVIIGIPTGTALIGLLYQRYHREDWNPVTAYVFAIVTRLCLTGLVVAFMWQTGHFG